MYKDIQNTIILNAPSGAEWASYSHSKPADESSIEANVSKILYWKGTKPRVEIFTNFVMKDEGSEIIETIEVDVSRFEGLYSFSIGRFIKR